MKKQVYILIAFLGAFILSACDEPTKNKEAGQNSASETTTQSITQRINIQPETTEKSPMPEIAGVTYYGDIPANPKRIVTFSGGYTGYLLKLGFKNIVGVSTYDKKNPVLNQFINEAKELSSSDLEAILALEPDVILIGSHEQNIKKLAEIAPVISIEYGKRSYLETMTDLGAIFNKQAEAEAWLKSWKNQIVEAREKIQAKIGKDKTFTIVGLYQKDTYLFGNNWGRGGEIIYQELEFQAPDRVVEEVFPTGFLSISREVLGDYIGDYVLVTIEEKEQNELKTSLSESDIWQNLPAVRNGNVIYVNSDLFYFNDALSLEKELEILTKALL